MTVTSTVSRVDYPGAGSAGPFAYPFRIYAATDLLVTLLDASGVETTLTYPADYSVSGISSRTGGTVTLSVDLAVGETLTIRRVRPLTQLLNLRNQGSTFPANVEDGFDQGTMVAQQLDSDLQASVRLPESIDPAVFDTTLPANLTPGNAIVVNAAGKGLSMGTLTAAQLSAWSATHNATLDVFLNGVNFTAGVSTTLTLSADPGNKDNCEVIRRTSGTVVEVMHDDFSVVGTTLTFGSVIPAGTTRIEVGYMYTYQVNRALPQNVPWAQLGTGAVTRNVRDKLREIPSVLDFGATGNGSTDDTAAIQAAITAVEATPGRQLHIPTGTYRLTAGLTFTKTIRFFGDGMQSKLVVDAAVGAGVDILTISTATASDDLNTGFIFEDFRLTPAAGTPGRHGIAIDITTRACYNSRFSGLRIDQFGGRGFATLPNATPLIDGFFGSVIEKCTIRGGIYLDKAGDSIIIRENVILGSNVGVYADLVSTVPYINVSGGAHGLDIVDNNITSDGGALLIVNAWQGCFQGNNCELPSPSGVAHNAMVDIEGTAGAGNATNGFLISRNFLAAPPTYDLIRVNYARHTQIINNYSAEPGGGGFIYRVTANATDTGIFFNVDGADTAISAQLTDAGARTCVFQNGLIGLMELTRSLFLAKAGLYLEGADTAGTAIPLIGTDGTAGVNTVRVGSLTAMASDGHLEFFVNGVERMRISPDGEVNIGGGTTTYGGTIKFILHGDLAVDAATLSLVVGAAGAAAALPATPEGYLLVKIDGNNRKIPYYL